MTEFVPALFGVKAGDEVPAGTSAVVSEDLTPAVHHTSPASLVWLCSLSLRQLPVYSSRLLHNYTTSFRITAVFFRNTQALGLIYLVFAG